MSQLCLNALQQSPHRMVKQSPHRMKWGNAKVPTVTYRHCTVQKIICGLTPFGHQSHNYPSQFPDLLARNPWAFYHRLSRLFASRSDGWSWDSPDGTGSYSGEMHLEGSGDCPQMSGYPEIVVPWTLVYHTPPDGGYWSTWAIDPAANWVFGIGTDNRPPDILTDNTKAFNDNYLPIYEEHLSMIQGGERDCTNILKGVVDSFVAKEFSTDWTQTTPPDYDHKPWALTYNDYVQVNPGVVDTYLLDPDDYDGSEILQSYNMSLTPTEFENLFAGWTCTPSVNGVSMTAVRKQIRVLTEAPFIVLLCRHRQSCGFAHPGTIWQGTTTTRQWLSRTECIGIAKLTPVDGEIVYEIPFVGSYPLPVTSMWEMPVLHDYNFLLWPGIDVHGYAGDWFKVLRNGVWTDEIERVPTSPTFLEVDNTRIDTDGRSIDS